MQRPDPSPHARRTLAAIDAYLEERTQLYGTAPERSRLFLRHDGNALTQQVLDRTLRRLARAAGVAPPEGAMAHTLRHTYGMDLTMLGVPLRHGETIMVESLDGATTDGLSSPPQRPLMGCTARCRCR
ncbi:MAG: tyrosine-type recombinase/integrase [Ilumatobacteraceae bacterium]